MKKKSDEEFTITAYKKVYEAQINTQYLRTNYNVDDPSKDFEAGKCNNYNVRKNDGVPKWIMQLGTVSDFGKTIGTFTEGKDVSGHYVIDKKGEIFQLVPDTHRAWEAGAGDLKYGSKLNKHVPTEILHNDMNSWVIGIHNVNNGLEEFPEEQITANVYLVNHLVNKYKMDPKDMIGHHAWTPGRKIDPSPMFPWFKFITATETDFMYPGVEHNFGIYPSRDTFMSLKKDPEVVISYRDSKKQDKIQILELQKNLEELGYLIIDEKGSNEGVLDDKTISAMNAFALQYHTNISGEQHSPWMKAYGLLHADSSNPDARGILGEWTENHDKLLGDLLDQS